jgi:TolB-like protein/tetratricopeptide (TPR) repeat protein
VSSLFEELKRRNVVRVAAAYAVVAWLLIEVSDTIFPRLGLPDWSVTLVIALVALGFPIALFLSWAYELTPAGVKRTEEVPIQQSVTRFTGRKLDFVIIGVLVVALGWFAWDRFAGGGGAVAGARDASIAVLPFVDMSAEGDQQYFGDGLSEEILNLLAGIDGLKVSGRTSSFAFKGTNTSIPEIGRSLGVAHVLEGSVRRAGDQLRITAQLVEAGTGFHLWSDTYDRRLEDVFAIQDEIAGSIADALRLTLVASAQGGTGDMEAYDLYLRARTLIYGRTVEGLREARSLIDRALALDPDYPPALAASGELWLLLSDSPTSYGDIPEDEANTAARAVLQRALALDPELADAHAAMGLLFMGLADYDSALAHLERALAINPSLTNANHWHGLTYSRNGEMRKAVESGRRFAQLDPLFVTNLGNLVAELGAVGEFQEAEELARRIQRSHPDYSLVNFGFFLREQGRLAEAVDFLEGLRAMGDDRTLPRLALELTFYNLGDYARALEVSVGFTEFGASIGLGRDDEGLAAVRARSEASPENYLATWGLLHGLALTGRHQELLDWVAGRSAGPAGLNTMVPYDFSKGGTLAPLAVAQRGMGRDAELAATLQYWGGVLAFLEENGFANSEFAFVQASFHALSGERNRALERLSVAIDRGHRDPMLFRSPPFEPWWNDADFRTLVDRNVDLINVERAKLGLQPLDSASEMTRG